MKTTTQSVSAFLTAAGILAYRKANRRGDGARAGIKVLKPSVRGCDVVVMTDHVDGDPGVAAQRVADMLTAGGYVANCGEHGPSAGVVFVTAR